MVRDNRTAANSVWCTSRHPGAVPTVPTMDDEVDYRGTAEVGHTHPDVAGGWLRASVSGAMDGLVTNISLVAGVGAARSPRP
jgi:hypothetical protein